jgi:hypothetical protein
MGRTPFGFQAKAREEHSRGDELGSGNVRGCRAHAKCVGLSARWFLPIKCFLERR